MGATVKFGPAGIPISSARNGTISGIARVAELGLEADALKMKEIFEKN